jgi:hypothetical protein
MRDLSYRAGEGWRSWLIPLAVDGMMVVASMVMLVRRKTRKPVGWLPWTALVFGLTASLAANVAAADPTLIGRVVAAWPPIALALAYELLLGEIKTTVRRPTKRRTTTARRRTTPAKTKPAAVRTAA